MLRFQISLRALLVAIVPLAAWLGFAAHTARTQKNAVAIIHAKGGRVAYRHNELPGNQLGSTNAEPVAPLWLRRLVSDDFFQTATTIVLYGEFSRADLDKIAGLTGLRLLYIGAGARVSQAGLQQLHARLPRCSIEPTYWLEVP